MGEKTRRLRMFGRARLLLALPVVVGAAAVVAAAPSASPSAPPPADRRLPAEPALRSLEARGHVPDALGPLLKNVKGPFRAHPAGRDQSKDPSRAYSAAERAQLVQEGKALFFSTTAFGQQPTQGPRNAGLVLSCGSCHIAPGQVDGITHVVGPVRERELGTRQTPGLFGLAGTAPYGWDGRNATLQEQSRGAIVSPLEMHAAREPTKRELDAIAEFIKTISAPPAVPGQDFDPVRAKRGEALFRTPRPVTDPTGEFPAGASVACATCHTGPFLTDGKAHREFVVTGDPVFDPGRVGADGTILGFDTPSLFGVRLTAPYFHDGIAGDPTAPSNFLGGGPGPSPGAARRALMENVLPFYNTVRFNFAFTSDELADLAEFLLSL